MKIKLIAKQLKHNQVSPREAQYDSAKRHRLLVAER
jgi:hypothetical protein